MMTDQHSGMPGSGDTITSSRSPVVRRRPGGLEPRRSRQTEHHQDEDRHDDECRGGARARAKVSDRGEKGAGGGKIRDERDRRDQAARGDRDEDHHQQAHDRCPDTPRSGVTRRGDPKHQPDNRFEHEDSVAVVPPRLERIERVHAVRS